MRDHDRRATASFILSALGLSAAGASLLAGCGGDVVVEDGGNGGGGNGQGGGSGGVNANGGNGTVNNSSSQTGSFGGFSSTSTGGGTCGESTNEQIDPPPDGPCSGAFVAQYVCFPKPSANVSCSALVSEACVVEAYSCGFQETADGYCGPDESPDACCYTVVGDCPVGRPFLVSGEARLAAREAGDGWASAVAGAAFVPCTAGLDDETRRALADFWGQEALAEHASIASFARFVMQLLAFGAPADLVRDASKAMAEELSHATTCFAFASVYAGAPQRPTALDVSGGLDRTFDATGAALSLAREGCIAETVSALQLREASEIASDPAVRAQLSAIADQELEHAVLAWRALAWLLARGDAELHAAVAQVFNEAGSYVGFGPRTEIRGDAARMRDHGYLPLSARRTLALTSLSTVVLPCAAALLAAHAQAAPEPIASSRAAGARPPQLA